MKNARIRAEKVAEEIRRRERQEAQEQRARRLEREKIEAKRKQRFEKVADDTFHKAMISQSPSHPMAVRIESAIRHAGDQVTALGATVSQVADLKQRLKVKAARRAKVVRDRNESKERNTKRVLDENVCKFSKS